LQNIEPYYRWRDLYTSETDPKSPFFGNTYSEFEFATTIYNYYIHPQWDSMGSNTLFLKIIFADYQQQYCIIELIGEWNDAIENDIMFLRKDIADVLFDAGITKFILIAENVLNFHSSERDYYEEWYENVTDENGWIVCLNMPVATQYDFLKMKLNRYVELKEIINWRQYKPDALFNLVDKEQMMRL
jgi:hypothetical protein